MRISTGPLRASACRIQDLTFNPVTTSDSCKREEDQNRGSGCPWILGGNNEIRVVGQSTTRVRVIKVPRESPYRAACSRWCGRCSWGSSAQLEVGIVVFRDAAIGVSWTAIEVNQTEDKAIRVGGAQRCLNTLEHHCACHSLRARGRVKLRIKLDNVIAQITARARRVHGGNNEVLAGPTVSPLPRTTQPPTTI